MSWPDATVVDACVRRDGRGGSPTAVTDDDPAATDADRRAVAAAAGTSHAAFLGPGRTPDGGRPVRFFTATAELSGCGHGTVAAQAVRLTRTALGELNDRQHTGGRTFDTAAIRRPAGIEVWFDQGLVALRHPAPDERATIVAALGLTADDPHPTDAPRIAAPGAPRMLVPVHDRSALLRVHPHLGGLVAAGWTISAIARRLHLDRKTVRRFRDTDLDQLLASAHERRPAGVLEPFKPYLNTRFTESLGQVSGNRLYLGIRERGYRGSRQVVRKHLAALRAGNAEPVRADIPSPREITGWIMRPQDTLPPRSRHRLLDVRITCPDIAHAFDLARAFAELLRHRRGCLLNEWIRQAEQDAPKPISGFAGFLRQDLDAVTAGLTLHWGSGVIEGHVNRVKTIDVLCVMRQARHANGRAQDAIDLR